MWSSQANTLSLHLLLLRVTIKRRNEYKTFLQVLSNHEIKGFDARDQQKDSQEYVIIPAGM